MVRLGHLLNTTRALSSHAQTHFLPVPDREDIWVVRITVGSVVVVETAAGPLDEVMELAIGRLAGMSYRMLAAVQKGEKQDKG